MLFNYTAATDILRRTTLSGIFATLGPCASMRDPGIQRNIIAESVLSDE